MMAFQGDERQIDAQKHDHRFERRQTGRELAAPNRCNRCQTIAATNRCRCWAKRCLSCAQQGDMMIGQRRQTVVNLRHQNAAPPLPATALIADRSPKCDGRRRRHAASLALALGLVACALMTASGALASPVPTGHLDAKCASKMRLAAPQGSLAAEMLTMLRCDAAPLYRRHHGGETGGEGRVARDLAHLDKTIDQFVEEALAVLSLREFCTYSTFSKMGPLRQVARENNLLLLAYDLVAMELHANCLERTIAKLPAVPHLVKDIVKIYIEGADKPLPDLNSPPTSDMDMDDDTPFDVEAAIEKNGSLEKVVGLSLTMFGQFGQSDQETAREFRATCKNFLIGIEQRWDTMAMMNSMVATDGSAIRQVNNYALRTLAPTKFADICSRISARA